MPRCLSEGVDIFLKSADRQGGANRTFATGGRCHGWQLEPCPCGLEPLLTFRQKIPTGRPYIEEGHSIRHGRSGICFTNSQFIILLVHTDNAGDFPHDGHSHHDTDGIIKMSLFYEIGDDHDFGNAVVATLLYHLCDADIVVAGGMENMTMAPYMLRNGRYGYRMGNATIEDAMIKDGLTDAFHNYHMGITAENICEQWGLTREEQQAARRKALLLLEHMDRTEKGLSDRLRQAGFCTEAVEDLFYQYVALLERQGETDHETVFVDGPSWGRGRSSPWTSATKFRTYWADVKAVGEKNAASSNNLTFSIASLSKSISLNRPENFSALL